MIKMEKYRFREYNSKYKKFFLKEKNTITKALGDNCFIEHVGSTSIPSLGGKGIVDVLVGVKSKNHPKFIKTLKSTGYEFREKASTSDRLFFRRDYNSGKETRRVHIHLTKFDGKDWNEMIAFRDYLLKHPEDVKKYVKIKKEAVEKAKGEGEIYREFKQSFMEEITRKQLAINELRRKVQEIVKIATTLKNKHISNKNAPVNYACIFSHSQKEYEESIRITQSIGKIVKETPTGLLFQVEPLKTVSGILKLLKIRIPDATRPELGDADFTITNFQSFKKKHLQKRGFKLIPREHFEMIELVDSKFNVRAYFSNPPLDKQLKIK
jgi:GrpB-like predicted nucleotidyltransferase (UPF0157 family)